KFLRWGADERRFHSLSADHGSSRPMSHRAAGVLVGGRATSLLQILCRNRRHGRKTAARQGVVCRERSARQPRWWRFQSLPAASLRGPQTVPAGVTDESTQAYDIVIFYRKVVGESDFSP